MIHISMMDTLKKFIGATPQICKTLESAANDVEKLIEYSSEVAEALIASLDHVASLEGDVAELKDQLLECKSPLKKSHAAASLVVSRLEKALQYGDITNDNEYKKNIIKSARDNRKYDYFNVYITQLGVYFEQCGKCYADFDTYHQEAKGACKKGGNICEKKRKEASGGASMGTAGRVAMGVGTVAGVAGIAGLATAAGFFTFGIGAPVVLGIAGTAAGIGAVGGTATAVAGKYTADSGDRYVKIESGFSTFLKGFDKIKDTAVSLETSVFKLSKVKEGLAMDKDSAKSAAKEGELDDYASFERTFEMLLNAIHDTRCKMNTYCESIDNVNEKIKKME